MKYERSLCPGLGRLPPQYFQLLLGMGLDEFSMSAGAILKARWIISNTSKAEMAALVNEILNLPTALDVERFIDENIMRGCEG